MGGFPESWLLVTVNQPSHCSWWIAAVNLEQSTSYLIAHVQLQKIPNIPNNFGPLDLASTKIQLILSFLNKSLFTIIFFSRLQCQLLFCNQPPSQLQSSNFDLAIVQGVGCTNLGMSNLLDSPPPCHRHDIFGSSITLKWRDECWCEILVVIHSGML